ncbi:MAG: ExeM/NucH family extracellular endonuclease [Lysobacterales bacterium]
MTLSICWRPASLAAALIPLLVACDRNPLGNGTVAYDAADLCGGRAVALHEIQGSGMRSPLLGSAVVVEAVVVRAATDTLGGVFVQDEQADRDGDLDSSEGLFVAIDGPPPKLAVGDVLRAAGEVQERGSRESSLTALGALTSLRVCGQSESLPDAALLEQAPLAGDGWERYEGMRVTIEAPLTVVDQGLLYRRGQLVVAFGGRQWQATEVEAPGEAARLLAAQNLARRIVLDDADLAEGPKSIDYLPRWPRSNRPLRAGSRLAAVTGVLDQREGQYRLYPESELEIEQAPRPDQPPAVDGRLRLASFNLLNYFNGDGQGQGFPTSRGAKTAPELQRQRDKLLSTMVALDADLFAVAEVENDGYEADAALPQLVEALDRKRGRRRDYQLVRPTSDRLGDDEITVGLIYDAAKLSLQGEAVSLQASPFDQGRPALAQRFSELSSGAQFTAVAVHLKSKGGCDDARDADADQNDGQGCFNGQRRRAVAVLADWLSSDPTGQGTDNVVILGDFNAYRMEDPIRDLRDLGYQTAAGDERDYSYSWRGELGSLDHAVISADLAAALAGFGVWHINADELVESDYRLEGRSREARRLYQADPFRSSDHDPLLLGLDLPDAADEAAP